MMTNKQIELETDVLVVGAGGAGMSAAIAAADQECNVLLADRSLISRGGATVMAQMTVAAALGEQVPDDWRHHYADTLQAGRGLCNEPLARLLCEKGVEAIRQMDAWGVGWARQGEKIVQAQAPGHDRPRCVYVDYLNTGPAVAQTLRTQVARKKRIRRVGDLHIIDLLKEEGRIVGALALDLSGARFVIIRARSVIIATGGLTRLYRRNSASLNMTGDGYALALRAGASLIDMEFVQFFPIGHLAPRLVGFDPIMWDPFRYKLGGRLLNGRGEEFVENYGHEAENERYTITRDAATYAIIKEVEAGRGSPAGGAYLSFEHVPESKLREAFGPIVDKLLAADIDLTKTAIEVAPIAHYHMGGIRVDTDMSTDVVGLYAAGEAVGGANGANRLSGNAITEAITFGFEAGRYAADYAGRAGSLAAARQLASQHIQQLTTSKPAAESESAAQQIAKLQDIMQDFVGPFRTEAGLKEAIRQLDDLQQSISAPLFSNFGVHDPKLADAFDLRNMLLVAQSVARSALARQESRGAHQREDYPGLQDAWELNQVVTWQAGQWSITRHPVPRLSDAQQKAVVLSDSSPA